MFQGGRVAAVFVALIIGIFLEQGLRRYVFTGADDYIALNKAEYERRRALERQWEADRDKSQAAVEAPPESEPSSASAPDAGSSSGWITYMEGDPATGARMFHARLRAAAGGASTSNRMDLTQPHGQPGEAVLTLGDVTAADCGTVSRVEATFDHQAAREFIVTAQARDGACSVRLVQADDFRKALLSADTLLTTPVTAGGRLGPVVWHVGGLLWNGD